MTCTSNTQQNTTLHTIHDTTLHTIHNATLHTTQYTIHTVMREERLSLKAEATVAALGLPRPPLSVDNLTPSNKSYIKSDLLSFRSVIRSSLGDQITDCRD